MLGRALRWPRRGFYVDVGAAHPTALSVTRLFYERGWNGVNIEPLPHMFHALACQRTRDVNLRMAASDHAGASSFFQVTARTCADGSIATGLSTFDRELAAHYRREGYIVDELTIPLMTLDAILDRHATTTIDFLKLDVEGHEQVALRGLNLSRHRPRILLIEAVRPLTAVPAYDDWEPLVTGQGYAFAADDGVNRYYVRDEDRPLAARLRPLAAHEYLRIGDSGHVNFNQRWLKPWKRLARSWLRPAKPA